MRGEQTELEKALEQVGEQTKRIIELERVNDQLRANYADAVRDKEAFRIRLDDLQRRVSAVADSMNYSFLGGRRP